VILGIRGLPGLARRYFQQPMIEDIDGPLRD